MLIDKHQADNIFRRVPELTIKMNPELTAIDELLDDDELFLMIRHDLARRYPQTESRGRKSTPVEVVLRMLAVKHLYDFRQSSTSPIAWCCVSSAGSTSIRSPTTPRSAVGRG